MICIAWKSLKFFVVTGKVLFKIIRYRHFTTILSSGTKNQSIFFQTYFTKSGQIICLISTLITVTLSKLSFFKFLQKLTAANTLLLYSDRRAVQVNNFNLNETNDF